uniref:Putative secreted peptide n=1 Tax=Anopheles braziliensis TaxID=58242 RepID=A0A2M3ZUV2_9DIPT
MNRLGTSILLLATLRPLPGEKICLWIDLNDIWKTHHKKKLQYLRYRRLLYPMELPVAKLVVLLPLPLTQTHGPLIAVYCVLGQLDSHTPVTVSLIVTMMTLDVSVMMMKKILTNPLELVRKRSNHLFEHPIQFTYGWTVTTSWKAQDGQIGKPSRIVSLAHPYHP